MPIIPEFTSPTDTLRPSETGVEAKAMAGRRAGAFFDQAATTITRSAQDQARAAFAEASAKEERARAFGRTAKDFAELGEQVETVYAHHEISHGAASFAQLHSELTDEWNNTAKNADPNDTSIAGRFHETVLEPKLDNFRQSFNTQQGQQWAEGHIAALRDHMLEKTSADMSTLAGDAVAVNVRKTTNAWTNTARNDPSAVPFLLDTADSSIAGIVSTSPNLKGADAAKAHSQLTQKAKEDIVRAGALGAIEKSGNPEAAAQQFAQRYPDYVNAQEIDQFAKAAKAFRSASAADAERARRLQKEQADDRSEKQRDTYIQDIFGDDSKTTMRQVLDDRNLVPKDREHLIGVLKNQGKTEVSDRATNTDLTKRLVDPDNPTTLDQVLKAHAAGNLNDADFRKRYEDVKLAQNAIFDDPIFKLTLRNSEKAIGTDPRGEELQAQFIQKFMRQYEFASRQGTLPPNALDLADENSMISQAMKPYMRSPQQRIMDRVQQGGGISVPSQQNQPTAPPPGGFVNVPPTLKTDDEIKSWAKAQGYPSGTKLRRADGRIGVVP